MTMRITRSPIWHYVNEAPTLRVQCPKCNNEADFHLAWDGEKGFLGLWWAWRVAVYRCPICPYYQAVPIESVNHLLG